MDTNIYSSPRCSPASSRNLLSQSLHSESVSTVTDLNVNLTVSKKLLKKHKECKKLEASVFHARAVFLFLVVACVLLLILYIFVIYLLLTSLPEVTTNKPQVSPRQQYGGQPDTGNGNGGGEITQIGLCVESEEVKEFIDQWKREDKESIRDLLKTGEYVHTYMPGVTDTHCFRNLKWMVKVLGKINTAVQESLDYIEHKQEGITKASDCCVSKDEEELSVCYTGKATKSEGNDGPGNVVFAHVFLNQSAKYDVKEDSDTRVLQWDKGVDSVSRGIKATPKLITVTQAGFYYVYSRVTLKENVTLTHQVISNRKGVLLSHTGKAHVSSLQGMLELRAQDALSVNATVNHLLTARFRATYFGAYLVRV